MAEKPITHDATLHCILHTIVQHVQCTVPLAFELSLFSLIRGVEGLWLSEKVRCSFGDLLALIRSTLDDRELVGEGRFSRL